MACLCTLPGSYQRLGLALLPLPFSPSLPLFCPPLPPHSFPSFTSPSVPLPFTPSLSPSLPLSLSPSLFPSLPPLPPSLSPSPRNKTAEGSPVNALALQDLVEKVILLRQAVARERRQFSGPSSSILAEKFRWGVGVMIAFPLAGHIFISTCLLCTPLPTVYLLRSPSFTRPIPLSLLFISLPLSEHTPTCWRLKAPCQQPSATWSLVEQE